MDVVTKHMLTSILSSKLTKSVESIVKYNLYSTAVLKDVNTAQTMMAAYFQFLVAGDDSAAIAFLSIGDQIPQITSSYIGVWLRDDFNFVQKDVIQALNTLARIVVGQRISVNSPFVSCVTSLEEKYSLCGYFTQYVIGWTEHACKLASLKISTLPVTSKSASVAASTPKKCANISSLPVTSSSASGAATTSKKCANISTLPVTSSSASVAASTPKKCANISSLPVTSSSASGAATTSKKCANISTLPVTSSSASVAASTPKKCANISSLPVTYSSASAAASTSKKCANISSLPVTSSSASGAATTSKKCANISSLPVTSSSASGAATTSKKCANISSLPVTSSSASAVASTPKKCANVVANSLESAVMRNDKVAIALLARDNVNKVTASGRSFLYTAVSLGFVEAAAILRAAGASCSHEEIKILLDRALSHDNAAIIKDLAKSGVNFSSFKNKKGDSYLHLAAAKGKEAVVEAMIDSGGMDINIRGVCRRTALHYASMKDQLSTVRLLLRKGAAVNVVNNLNETPLHDAAKCGYSEVIAALSATGADVNIKNISGKTPLDLILEWTKARSNEAAKLIELK